MDSEEFEDLHVAIASGDLESVRRIAESHGEEQFFSFEETSALYKAFECKEYEIISYLIHKGAKFVGSEDEYVYSFDIDLDRLNYLLLQYNKKTDKSCVYRLISYSQSPQVLDGERLNAIMSMYEQFFESDTIKLLMKVLESEPFNIVYDFQSDKVNRIHRLYEEEAEIYGLTLSNSKEIFVGAKNLLTGDPRKRAKVYGVVAEELCHLALTTVFKNNAKPYREEDSKLIKEFHDIVLAVKAFIARSCHVESVIPDVFEYYNGYSWECELIARVPHVIGIYGEDEGRKIFQESSELYRLLTFYEQKIHKKCKLCIEPSLNTKAHREMEQLVTKDFISYKEKQIRPLNENFHSFRSYLVVWESVSVITTNCARLCMLHVYHELKKEYECLVEKKCLFFSRKCFEKNIYKIRDTMKGNLWEYLILLMDKRELNLSRFQAEYLDHLEDFTTNGTKLIMISSSQSTDQVFDFEKAVNYKWSDLSEEYKSILQGITYLFKGEEEVTYVKKEYFPKVFDEDDISVIISSEMIEVDDGNELFSQGYVPDTYIKREFYLTVVDNDIFKNLPPRTNIFLSGLVKGELKEWPFDEKLLQWLKGSHDEIQSDRSIFVINEATPKSFEEFRNRNPNKKCIWLHYDEKEFHVRNLSSSGDVFNSHFKQKTFSEEEMLNFLKRKRILVISDNAGYGKSTVISSLIDNMKRNNYRSWNWRVNFNKFSGDIKDPLSIANVDENSSDQEVLDHLFSMLGLKNGLERDLFRKLSREGQCFIFFDGFDEIPPDYLSNALKLLSTVRKQTANMIISTRKHRQEELEKLFNTYSHQLVPLSRIDQVRYLERLWKSKLKYPHGKGTLASQNDKKRVPEKIKKIIQESEEEKTKLDQELHVLIIELKEIKLEDSLESVRSKIDDLKFSKLAKTVIDKTSLDKDTLEFMGIPLHLFMIGVIYLDGNFTVEMYSDIYSIYSRFVEQKILIYVEEKQGILYYGRGKKSVIEKERKNAYRIHIELANQLMEEGRMDSEMSEEDLELCCALGIVFIKGAEVDFLHHTFAEYFKAESIRLGLNKHVFIHVLFDDKYDVVRRFLSSAFVTYNFENLTKEFFEDLDFLFPVLKRFVSEDLEFQLGMVELISHLSTVAKIVKCLLEVYEKTVDEDLWNVFVARLESKLLSSVELYRIGGCLTVKILRMLFYRSLNENFKLIFGVARHYSNPGEAIEVLSDCISTGECAKNGAEIGGNENKKSENLLRFLRHQDPEENYLLYWAVCNVKAEVFANILKFSQRTVGEDEFFNTVVESDAFRTVMEAFIDNVDFNTCVVLLKALHSLFGKGLDIFFHVDHKCSLIRKILFFGDGLSGSFKEGVDVFREYFGIEKLKEVLLFCDYGDNNLVHYILSTKRRSVEYLSIIKNVLDDESKVKQILMSQNWMSRNVLHFAVENRNINFGEILRFCRENLETGDVKEMILRPDTNGWNVLHLLFKHNSSEVLIENLNLVKGTIADDELFKQHLRKRDREYNNIFHLVARNKKARAIKSKIFASLHEFHLSKSEIKDLLIGRDKNGRTCVHCVAFYDSTNLHFLLEYLHQILKGDRGQFEQLILSEDLNGNSFLHLFLVEYYIFNLHDCVSEVMKSLTEKLSEEHFQKLLRMRNINGETFLQLKTFGGKRNIDCLKAILGEDLFEELSRVDENA